MDLLSDNEVETQTATEDTQQLEDIVQDDQVPEGWVPVEDIGDAQDKMYKKMLANGFEMTVRSLYGLSAAVRRRQLLNGRIYHRCRNGSQSVRA